MKRLVSAFASMVLGSILVLGMVVLINHFADGLDRNDGDDGDQIVFERKPPPKKEVVQQPKPKPKPRRAPRTPPPPLAGLSGNLSGIDFGLPGFDMSDLNALDGDLLGGADSMVMTDDTVDDPPRATFQSPMQYPPRAKAQGVKGYVVLSLLIGVTGEIEQIEIVESSPEGVFDEVAVQGVSTWRFEPATYQGKAVRAWAKQRVRFDLS
ncbi:energy transducer TonB [Marinihelvus fidelis]|uniref:Protein TonB n=2 Tax=Marinihelvus fidelis TaxID=2613842 RepID=A0A5N0T4Q4_9GAMM|nr:energy transducer TonB [Marinihelvus fidelis]